jgi:hypothetical protein
MINFTFGVPVKTRLPPRAWVLAALVLCFPWLRRSSIPTMLNFIRYTRA